MKSYYIYIYLNSQILNTTLFYFSNTLEKLINPKVYTNHIYIFSNTNYNSSVANKTLNLSSMFSSLSNSESGKVGSITSP